MVHKRTIGILVLVLVLVLLAVLMFTFFTTREWKSYRKVKGVQDIAFDSEGNMWIASNNRVHKWNPSDGSYTTYTVEDGLVSNFVCNVAVAQDDTPWIGYCGYENHISHFDDQAWTVYNNIEPHDPSSMSPSIYTNYVSDMFIAPDGTLWIATFGAGIVHFDGQSWTTYTTSDGLTSNNIWQITLAPDQTIWFSTQRSLERFDGEEWMTWPLGRDDDTERALGIDSDGAILFSENTLTRFDGQTFNVNIGSRYATEYTDIDTDPTGTVWAAPAQNGIFSYDRGTWTHYTTRDGLASNNVNTIAIAPDGTVWAGTDRGISHYEPQE